MVSNRLEDFLLEDWGNGDGGTVFQLEIASVMLKKFVNMVQVDKM